MKIIDKFQLIHQLINIKEKHGLSSEEADALNDAINLIKVDNLDDRDWDFPFVW